jgi:hypothetical protein
MKSIGALHTSFGVYAGVLAVAVVVVAVLAASGPGGRRLLPRLGRCAFAGVAVAGALVWFADAKRHAQLVKQAAVPVNGHHVTVAHMLADGFAGVFFAVTAVAFIIASLAARRRAPVPGRMPARPRAGAGTWPS